mgnify:CR=1 FL=1
MYNSTDQIDSKQQDEAKHFVKSANAVRYSVLADPTLVQHRSYKTHAFQIPNQDTDSNGNFAQPLICKFMLQREFIAAKSSYLKFSVRVDTTGTPGEFHANGVRWNSSVLDLFQSIRLTSRDGTCIEYIENADVLQATIAQTTYESDFLFHGAGKLAGYNPDDGMATFDGVESRTYIVPLKMILGLASAEDLLPPQLMDGCTLEIHLHNINNAICRVADSAQSQSVDILIPGTVAQIRDVSMVTDSYLFDNRLYDMIEKEYQTTGLPIKFPSYTNTRMPVSNNSQLLNFTARQSATRATKLIGKMSTVNTNIQQQGFSDNHRIQRGGFLTYAYSGLQCKLGDRFIPERALGTPEEASFHWLCAFHKCSGGCTAVAREFLGEFEQRGAFVFSLDRGVSKKTTSGVTVSTKYPLRVNLSVEDIADPVTIDLFSPPFPVIYTFSFQRYLDTFLEHERVVIAASSGTQVML